MSEGLEVLVWLLVGTLVGCLGVPIWWLVLFVARLARALRP
jgi:hypothetical protein